MKHGEKELDKLLYKFTNMSTSDYIKIYNKSILKDEIKILEVNTVPLPQLKALSKKSGISLDKLEKEYYPKAKKAAKDMGMEKNFAYIYGVLENMLGISESTFPKFIADEFAKSDIKSLKKYIENMKEEITSSDVSPTPEKAPKDTIVQCDKKKKKKKDIEKEEEIK